MALSVSAPKGFTDWLLELDGDILNETPLTSKSRGIDVTRFLLEEATEQDIEAFLNVRFIFPNIKQMIKRLTSESSDMLLRYYSFKLNTLKIP